ncbi:MAG TPA: hypothetical protein VF620_16670 [Allosphingosinicella sp.]|jgi:hypothetical protein
MRFSAFFGRGGAALAALTAGSVAPVATAPVEASTPSLMWRDLRGVGVQCLVQNPTKLNTQVLETALCERVRSLVAEGAPVPVKRVSFGDPAILAAGTVTLLLHASVESTGGGFTLNFAIRPIRPSSPDAEIYFGTAPRMGKLAGGGDLGHLLDSSLSSALAELLPWKRALSDIRAIPEVH